jgi:nitroreductase
MQSQLFSTAETAAVERVLLERRSIQKFQTGAVDPALVRRGIEAACLAPNHKLTEPWRFYLIGEEAAKAVVARNTEMVRAEKGDGAAANKQARWSEIPHWLVLTCRKSRDAFREKEDYAACCCAAENLMLFLWAHGVGSKWTTGPVTRDGQFFEILGISPEREIVVSLLQYGFPAVVPAPQRGPVDDFIRVVP